MRMRARWRTGTIRDIRAAPRTGGTTSVEPFWALLAADGAEVVLNGHEHNYERFGAQRGITEFVIGTGGRRPSYPFGGPSPAA